MSDKNLKVGDVVRLRSGGPYMTITRTSGTANTARYGSVKLTDGLVVCGWFVDRDGCSSPEPGVYKTGLFYVAILDLKKIER